MDTNNANNSEEIDITFIIVYDEKYSESTKIVANVLDLEKFDILIFSEMIEDSGVNFGTISLSQGIVTKREYEKRIDDKGYLVCQWEESYLSIHGIFMTLEEAKKVAKDRKSELAHTLSGFDVILNSEEDVIIKEASCECPKPILFTIGRIDVEFFQKRLDLSIKQINAILDKTDCDFYINEQGFIIKK